MTVHDYVVNVLGKPYSLSLVDYGEGRPYEVDWFGRTDFDATETKTSIDLADLMEKLKKRGVEFTPLGGVASPADVGKLDKLEAKINAIPDREQRRLAMREHNAQINAFHEQGRQKRVQMFERLLGGKAEQLPGTNWYRIGPVLALLAALGLLGRGEE